MRHIPAQSEKDDSSRYFDQPNIHDTAAEHPKIILKFLCVRRAALRYLQNTNPTRIYCHLRRRAVRRTTRVFNMSFQNAPSIFSIWSGQATDELKNAIKNIRIYVQLFN